MLNSFFRPAYLKEADLMVVNARKLLHRKRDLLSDEKYARYSAEIDELATTAQNGGGQDRSKVEAAIQRIDQSFGKIQPAQDDAGWRENVEVLLVAFVLAIAIRSYFLQPFKIPTGSMEPTLNGIVGHPTAVDQPLPGVLRRVFDSLWLGRTYVNVVSAVDDRVRALEPQKPFGFMDYTKIVCASGRVYSVHAAKDTLVHYVGHDGFGVYEGRSYKAGEPIVHGYVDTGDQVFVDKFTYNFRRPRRGDVFVFDTNNIPVEHGGETDVASIPSITSSAWRAPRATSCGSRRRGCSSTGDSPGTGLCEGVGAEPGSGYRGYSGRLGQQFVNLTTPTDTFTVPPESYFALGDNSYNSSDSRVWGRVPAENVVGRGLYVYWPFTRHWGFIH